ncbi:TetR/AcrR family transcriptional regulator, partial [Mycobacterium sp. CBMA361]|nr:TetR/AcrR family transcriptional regulator [Mycolicibacterium sp. CBMA 361]
GVAPEQAAELAMLATTAIEGAVLVARTTSSTTPLDLVHRQLRALVTAATTQRKASS